MRWRHNRNRDGARYKLEILTPYLALAGLIAVISTVVIVKKRKD